VRIRNTNSLRSHRRVIKLSAKSSLIWVALLLALGATLFTPYRIADAAGPSLMQFSASTYNVNEGLTFRTITVLRTGDVSGPATVDYSTSGVEASQRTDFTFAHGTLRFAAGESSKSFDVLISRDNKIEGPESFTVSLSGGSGQAFFGTPATASIVIADDPIGAAQNPIDFPDIFVGQHYHDFLTRHADNGGQLFWENQIVNCGADAACIDDRRTNVSAAFFLSIEFQQTGYFVIRIHKAAFGSGPSVPRYLRFLRDQRRVTDGVIVRNTGWETLLAANRQAYLEEFVSSPEFLSAFQQGIAAETYVDRLFANAGATPIGGERQTAIAAYGTGNTLGRAAALRSVVDSDSVYDKQYNPAFVLMQYFGYLRRDPDEPPDNNFNGYNFWLTKLTEFSTPGENVRDEAVALARVKRAEMVRSFLVSTEYRQRFGQ
jgi:hypothetical protein